MNKAWFHVALYWLAGVVFCAGIGAAILNLWQYDDVNRKLAKSIKASGHLDALDKKSESLDAVVRQFDALGYDNLINLRESATRAFGKGHVDAVRESSESCDEGFSVNRHEMVITDISLGTLLPFVGMVESQRPPLRLSACKIHSSASRPGYGDVTLTLERVER